MLLLATAVLVAVVGVAAAVTHTRDNKPLVTIGRGPGTPMLAGLVVPPGALLLAEPHAGGPDDRLGTTDATAELQIVGDPLAVWADLVEQVATLGGTLPSSGVCFWNPDNGYPAPLATPRPSGLTTVECVAGATLETSGDPSNLSLDLWLTEDGAELALGIDHGSPTGPVPETDPGPVQSADLRGLPEDRTPEPPDVGEPFGPKHNCFETGYARFRVPEGATFRGGGRTPATNPILAVDDPEAVLRALRAQLDDPADPSGTYDIAQQEVGDEVVWTLSGSVSAGGGTCTIHSFENGHALVLTTHSD